MQTVIFRLSNGPGLVLHRATSCTSPLGWYHRIPQAAENTVLRKKRGVLTLFSANKFTSFEQAMAGAKPKVALEAAKHVLLHPTRDVLQQRP